MSASETIQTIKRLTPLTEVLATVDMRVKPVTPRTLDITAACNRVLAADVAAPLRPSSTKALIDGWAIMADTTLGAGGYAPVELVSLPQRIESGYPLPPDCDSVAPFDAIKVTNGKAEALVTINPGDGILPPGGDSDPDWPMRLVGERLRLTDIAALIATGLSRVTVREPRVRVLPLRGSSMVIAASQVIAGDIERHGGQVKLDETTRDFGTVLAAENTDALVVIGGTGSGRNDNGILTLAREGEVVLHGMGITPGETAAFGFTGTRPVLMLPGRLDAALAVWMNVGRRMLERLVAAHVRSRDTSTYPLARKISSTVGLAEVVPVKRVEGKIEPLAVKYLSLTALARSDGWVLVPAESEGYAADTALALQQWP